MLGLSTLVGGSVASASTTIDGPDVSSYQHPYGAPIKWAYVAKAGKEFAIVKATEGTSYVNPWFKTDYPRIRQVGMVRGSYHFARPAYPVASTASAQAHYYVRRLGTTARTSHTLPPALDLEISGGLSRGALVSWAQTFLLTVRRLTGRTPMLYTYPSFYWSALGDPVALQRYPLWMASYGTQVDSSTTTLWQYTSTASVRGIRGSVDMSRLVSASGTWKSLSDGRPSTAWPAQVPGAPQAVAAKAAAGRATISWLPGDSGSRALQSYRVTASPGGASVVVDATHFGVTMTGLHNGTPYTFTVQAINGVGAGTASVPTAAVTPMVPTKLVLKTPASIVYGATANAKVTLTRTDSGKPLANRTVALQTRPVGTTKWSDPVNVVTDSYGHATASFVPTGNVDVRASYSGPVGETPAHVRTTVLVATGVLASLSPAEAPLGTSAVITGSIAPATAGLTVTLQRLRSGVWSTLQTSVTDAAGGFTFTVTPTATGQKSYRVVSAAAGPGLQPGVSSTMVFTVDAPVV